MQKQIKIRHRTSTSTHWHFPFSTICSVQGYNLHRVCCHSNETRALIANLPNSAQLEGTPYHSPSYIWVCALVWEWGDGQTDRQTDTQLAVVAIYILLQLRLMWNVTKCYSHKSWNTTHQLYNLHRVCCHSNETRAPIANLPNSAQLEGTPYHSPSYIWVRALLWECGDGQTDRHTDGCGHYIHFASAMPHAKCNKMLQSQILKHNTSAAPPSHDSATSWASTSVEALSPATSFLSNSRQTFSRISCAICWRSLSLSYIHSNITYAIKCKNK